MTKNRAEIEVITPSNAKKYLDSNKNNRPINQAGVDRYARAMREGKWDLNGQTITFDTEGNVLDGQHRLSAVVQSNTSIETYVVRGILRESFDTIDVGRNRTTADLLSLQGNSNSSILATAARFILCEEVLEDIIFYAKPDSMIITPRDIVECVEQRPALIKSAKFLGGIHINRILGKGIAAYLHYKFAQINEEKADYFLTKLAKGDGLGLGDPILNYRNLLIRHSFTKGNNGRIEMIALGIKAWNLFIKGKKSTSLRWQESEPFPIIDKKVSA